MKKIVRRIYTCLLATAMVLTVTLCIAACEKKSESGTTNVPAATYAPSDQVFAFALEGSEDPKPGETVSYKVSVKDVTVKDNIIGLDFFLTYNTDMFTYVESKITKAPTSDWWLIDVDDGEAGRVRYHSCGDVESAVITGDGQYEVTVTFSVKENAKTDKDWLVKIETGNDAKGTDFSPSFNVIYGTGSEIKKG